MILGFRLSNYRSFKDETSVSMLATRLDQNVGHPVPVAEDGTTKEVLPVLAVLGANASGKSNLLQAIGFMRSVVLESGQTPPFEPISRDPFRFDRKSSREPSLFEIEFAVQGVRYTYGFELGPERVNGEWLFTYPHKRPQVIFERDRDDFQFGKRLTGGRARAVGQVVRPNSLFLTAVATSKAPELTEVLDFFYRKLNILATGSRSGLDQRAVQRLKQLRGEVLGLAALADMGIREAHFSKPEPDPEELESLRRIALRSLPKDMPEDEREAYVKRMVENIADHAEIIELIHGSETGGASIPFEEESLGTRSWLTFLVYALDALKQGGTLVVDELDLSLHPILVREAIGLFQNKRVNTRQAQLIFSTHDATLLGRTQEGLDLSRGQIWFAEKDKQGRSSLTPLSDYRPRKGEDLEKGYLQGRYGGTPRITRGSVSGAAEIGGSGSE